jgi:electron transfer flavoprotein alpha subunit
MSKPLRVAVLAKQVPRFEEFRLRPDGRLDRRGAGAEINPYCRRAIAKGVEVARAAGGSCTVFTLGPPDAREVLEEAVAWGADDGVLISDPAFAGSDTLATAGALAAAIRRLGPFGLIIGGLNSVDAETGQVAPQLAELLGLPLATGVRELDVDGPQVRARCERDDGFVTLRLRLPAVLTAAERLCAPCKVPPEDRAGSATAGRIRVLPAAGLGPGPWGQAGSPTTVGEVRHVRTDRRRLRLSGPLADQAGRAAEAIRAAVTSAERLARAHPVGEPVPLTGGDGPVVAAVGEPGRERITGELLGAAAGLAAQLGGRTVLLSAERAGAADQPGSAPCAQARWVDPAAAWAQGADEVVVLTGAGGPAGDGHGARSQHGPAGIGAEDAAAGIAAWAGPGGAGGSRGPGPSGQPWAILVPSTSWGREVAGRVSARLGAGLTGDAVALEVAGGRLLCWKPAFGGQLNAAVTASSAVQMATVRPGVLPLPRPRAGGSAPVRTAPAGSRGWVTVDEHVTNDDPERLMTANTVVCVGGAVDPGRYHELRPLLDALGAELAGSRKVADAGWLPRSRQVGITGRAVAPDVYVLLGVSGKFNHMVGSRGAGLVVAVNNDPRAPVFDAADIGIVGDWAEAAGLLAGELRQRGSAVLGGQYPGDAVRRAVDVAGDGDPLGP